ncbi:MAG: SepM family pheromone-processing serine protease [Vagococcus sp.]|uniref:SepM family pheromone-processing serine protease n=1 Tax=Vagococcus sp. TaxID=1933889 RepID=UPI002FCB7F30
MRLRERKGFKFSIIGIIVLMLLVTIVPIPYFIEMPGSSENLRDYVSVDGKRDKYDGSFMLTTVSVQQATVATLIKGYINPTNDLISKKEMMGTDSNEEYDEMQRYNMETSQNIATQVALDFAKEPYKVDYKGVYVMSVDEKSNFSHRLKVGDTITQIDDKKIETSKDLISYIKNKRVDEEVTITYESNGKIKKVSGDLISLPETKKAGMGISLVDHTEIETEQDVKFNTEEIGGPSAGLMFTLELYSLITKTDIRNGKDIAGTGTISTDGVVGRIGGIDKKVIAADQEGAELFFAPDDLIEKEDKKLNPKIKTNYQEAKDAVEKNNLSIKVIPVKTVKDALDYLEKEK